MRLYRLVPFSPWGDYGWIIIHGMTRHLPRLNGELQWERGVPPVPEIACAGDVVVSERVRDRIGLEGLSGVGFVPVRVARAVEFSWSRLDFTLESPPDKPHSGEPEDYVLGRPHDAALACAIGPRFELVCDAFGKGVRTRIGKTVPRVYSVSITLDGAPPDFFRVPGAGSSVYCTERAMNALGPISSPWVGFAEVDEVIVL